MGMYTELIFGAELKMDTPQEVIDDLKWLIETRDKDYKPKSVPLKERTSWMFNSGGSYYFAVRGNLSHSAMRYDKISMEWSISARFNIKNYDGEIESFLEWIKPYIGCGSGANHLYAIVIPEEGQPKMYFKY